jgi:diguanylate cyclase (GGDEF)-like protein
VLYLDLDGFKRVNDRLGHEAGDELLTIVGRRLLGAARSEDLVARFGGDEFTVLLTDLADAAEARVVAERLLGALRQSIVLAEGRLVAVGACAGIAAGSPGRTTPGELLRAADVALYRAKAVGPNSVALFEPPVETARVAS